MAKGAKTDDGLTAPQEVFAQLVASGRSQAEAYRTAYPAAKKWKPESVYPEASKLMADPKVSTRVAVLRTEVQLRVIEEAAVTPAFVTRGLKTVALRCLQAAPVLDKKGFPKLIEVKDEHGETIGVAPAFEFEPHAANRAFELMGKEIGMFVDRKETGKPGEFAHMTDAEVEAEAKAMLEEAVKGGLVKVLRAEKGKATPAGAKRRSA
jgi:phage terminase small subunit